MPATTPLRPLCRIMLAALALVALVAACERAPLSSDIKPPAPRSPLRTALAFSGSATIEPGAYGETEQTIFVAPRTMWLKVELKGTIHLEANPSYYNWNDCHGTQGCVLPLSGKDIGPEGLSYCSRRGCGVALNVTLSGIHYYEGWSGAGIIYVDSGQVVQVKRRGLDWFSATHTPAYLFTDGQISARWSEVAPQFEITSVDTIFSPGQVVRFGASGALAPIPPSSPFGTPSYVWEFAPGDTAATPAFPDWRGSVPVWECRLTPTCDYKPTRAGRMYLRQRPPSRSAGPQARSFGRRVPQP